MIVANDTVNAARDVTKQISYRLETYGSRDLGVLGLVDDDQVTFYRQPLKKHTTATPFDVASLQKLPRVDIVYTYADADGVLIEAAVEQGKAEGLVIAAFPTGSPSPAMEKSLAKITAKGVPVVITNRGGMGRVRDTRAGTGDARRNYLWGDNLTPQKARILLMLALTRTRDAAELQRMFEEY